MDASSGRPGKAGGAVLCESHQYVELVSPSMKGLDDRMVRIGFSTTDAEAMRRFPKKRWRDCPRASSMSMGRGTSHFCSTIRRGHSIEFTQQGPHAPSETKSANPASVHINHAGFVVRDRPADGSLLQRAAGVSSVLAGRFGAGSYGLGDDAGSGGNGLAGVHAEFAHPPSRGQLGSANHFSPGVVSMAVVQQKLTQNGWAAGAKRETVAGRGCEMATGSA